jgi:hypothetical protein
VKFGIGIYFDGEKVLKMVATLSRAMLGSPSLLNLFIIW